MKGFWVTADSVSFLPVRPEFHTSTGTRKFPGVNRVVLRTWSFCTGNHQPALNSGMPVKKLPVKQLCKTLSFLQIVNYLLTEGTVPVSPNRLFALRLCRITFSGIIALGGGATAAGAEALHVVALQRALRKIF